MPAKPPATLLVVLWFVLLPVFIPSNLFAQVVINEVNPSEEWVELYNLGSNTINLEGCYLHLHQESYSGQKINFTSDDKIDKFTLIRKGDYNWSSNWLKDSEDNVVLKCPDFVDSVDFGKDSESGIGDSAGKSIGRNPDGTGTFFILEASTPGTNNSSIALPTPTPTAKASATPKIVKTEPTSTKLNNKTIQPTIHPSQALAENETILSASTSGKDIVLGVQSTDTSDQPQSSDVLGEEGETTSKSPLLGGIFALAGICLIGGSAYPVYKKLKEEYNFKGDD